MPGALDTTARLAYRGLFGLLRAWWFLRRPRTQGALAALWHDGEILMLRTSYRRCLSLPGGFVRAGEAAEAAARREAEEELGLDLAGVALRRAWNGTLHFESRSDTVEIWEAQLDRRLGYRVGGREVVWAGWVEPAEIRAGELLPHVAAYLAGMRERGGNIMDREKLKAQLIEHEGLELKPYRCTSGKVTIGVGRNLDDKGITEHEAMMLLENDIDECLAGVRQLFPGFDDLDDVRQRVLVDMRFNMGQGGLEKFRNMRTAVEEGDFDRAAAEMENSTWAGQVGRRADNLIRMMREGSP